MFAEVLEINTTLKSVSLGCEHTIMDSKEKCQRIFCLLCLSKFKREPNWRERCCIIERSIEN